MEKLQALNRAALTSYDEILRAAAEYPIEIEASDAQIYQRHVHGLRKLLDNLMTPEEFHTIHASFRGEVRDYRDKANEWLAGMRNELKSAAEAMQTLSIRVAENGNGHETHMKSNLERLKAAAQTEDLGRIKMTIHQVATSISRSYEQLRDANNLMIAQLRDEIQSLHREMDNSRRTLFVDRASGAWNRPKLESHIDEMLERGEGFVAIVVWVSNMKRLEAGCSGTLINAAMKALVQRASAVVGAEALIGRWADDLFLMLLDIETTAAVAISNELGQKLSSRYAVQQDGISHQVNVHVATAVVDQPPNGDPRKYRARLEQMTGVLLGQ
ncbi:MAG: GGDEF domain-containing protein [Bryobacterales bacterium]|nr:GGDEF domain-containing protein [Bryobacterales bacterium]MBV9400851.1 GGDEF domain-containing protein [Bryobacterales bacterium]